MSRSLVLSIALIAFAAIVAPPLTARAECSPSQRRAIDLSNDADRLRAVDLDGAIAKYEQALALDPENHRILHKLALTYTKKESWEAAARADEKAATLAPTFASYFATAGRARARLAQTGKGTWQDARAPLEKALKLDPRLGDAHYELGEALLRQGDEQGALVHYSKAVACDPHEAAFWAALADLYIRLRYYPQAEKTLQQALTFVPADRRFALESQYGDVLSEQGDMNGSLLHFEEARRSCGSCSEPGQAIAFFNLGTAYGTVSPPRRAEAMQNLQTFNKLICKGAAAARYQDQCRQAQDLANKMGAGAQ